MDPCDVHRLGVDDRIRQSSGARTGLAGATADVAGVLPRLRYPLPGLGAGPLLLTLVLTVLLMPALVGVSRRVPQRRQWIVPAALVLIALVYRTACTVSGDTGLFGPLSWLPNHLDLVAVGLAVALVDASVSDLLVRRRLASVGLWLPQVPSFLLASRLACRSPH